MFFVDREGISQKGCSIAPEQFSDFRKQTNLFPITQNDPGACLSTPLKNPMRVLAPLRRWTQ